MIVLFIIYLTYLLLTQIYTYKTYFFSNNHKKDKSEGNWFQKHGLTIKNIVVEEGLDQYWMSLKDIDIQWSRAESKYYRDMFGLELKLKENEKMLKNAANS